MSWCEEVVTTWLLEAGEIALDYFKRAKVSVKSDESLVTEADLAVDQYFKRVIEEKGDNEFLFCEESIADLNEEEVNHAFAGNTYVLDPIDGTINYASGLELWGISLAYMQEGKLVEGAIYLPLLDLMLITKGDKVIAKSMREGEIIELKAGEGQYLMDNDKSLIAITQKLSKFGEINFKNPVHSVGVAVYPLAYLIKGHYCAYIGNLKMWDMAGAMPMLERLGFDVILWNGEVVTNKVEERTYYLENGHEKQWGLKDYIVFCRKGMFDKIKESVKIG